MRWQWPAVVALCIAIGCGDNITVTDDCGSCSSPAQIACEGRTEGVRCSVADVGTGICVHGGCVIPICGNGIIEPNEACDDGNTNSSDGCNATCTSNETCGNNFIDPREVCDDGNTTAGDGCNSNCMSNETCGNGYRDPFEVCDDGNTLNGDGCGATCRTEKTCGNGLLEKDLGEQCDDGNSTNNDGCDANCRLE